MTPAGETVRRRLLQFIIDFQDERGFPPSIREMVSGAHISSTSVAEYHLCILQGRGWIRRVIGQARTLKVSESARRHARSDEPIRVPKKRKRDRYFDDEDVEVATEVVPLPYPVNMPKRVRRK